MGGTPCQPLFDTSLECRREPGVVTTGGEGDQGVAGIGVRMGCCRVFQLRGSWSYGFVVMLSALEPEQAMKSRWRPKVVATRFA